MSGPTTQWPLISYGDTEAIDILMIGTLKEIAQFFRNQQGDPKPIQVQAQWSRTRKPNYPLLSVMAVIPEYAPSSIEDLVEATDSGLLAAEFNDVEVNIEIQAYGLRELQRVRSFLYANLKYGFQPDTNFQWAKYLVDRGIVLNKWDVGLPFQVDLQVQGHLSLQPTTTQNLERTDVEILWQQDVTIMSNAQLGFKFDPDAAGIILGVDLNITPDFLEDEE